jgi:hypothetical protein
MSTYTDNYKLRYSVPSIQQQIEVAVVHVCGDIQNEDAGASNHTNRLAWATWANTNSSAASIPFAWPVGLNPAIQASIATDPTGASIPDGDVQFVVNSNVDKVIADFIANPPPGAAIPAA